MSLYMYKGFMAFLKTVNVELSVRTKIKEWGKTKGWKI